MLWLRCCRDPAGVHSAAVGVREAGIPGTDKSGVCSLRFELTAE